MNTCYCLRLPQPHPRTLECETYRIDRMIQRRESERRLDEELDEDPDYKRQDRESRNVGGRYV